MKKTKRFSPLKRWLGTPSLLSLGLITLVGCAGSHIPDALAQSSDRTEVIATAADDTLNQQNDNQQNNDTEEAGLSPLTEPGEAAVDTANAQADSSQHSEIPIQFQGTWDLSSESCSSGSDGRFRIYADSLRSYAAAGPVTEVVIHNDSEMTVTAVMTESGYPPFTFTRTYLLSADRSELTDVTSGLTRQKCPDETAN